MRITANWPLGRAWTLVRAGNLAQGLNETGSTVGERAEVKKLLLFSQKGGREAMIVVFVFWEK